MRPSGLTAGVLLAKFMANETSSNSLPDVPAYNMSLPVDHFDSSNTDTFPNRYFVNDTYYKPGGPVILFDFGESGISPVSSAIFLAEYTRASAPLRLAEKLNGLVIGWEHRYYGYSRPVTINDSTGLPEDGASGYKYLTVDQAIEDATYFANNFNKTKLDKNHVIASTENVDPYHTPWIFMGGSYPGARAAWARVQHPEVWYASWASSGPVQAQSDGSIYFNPGIRALPKNCSSDIEAAVKYVDETLSSGDTDNIRMIQAIAFLGLYPEASVKEIDEAFNIPYYNISQDLVQALTWGEDYQSYGAHHITQVFCDYMETFDAESFLSTYDSAKTFGEQASALYSNKGGSSPTDKGIADSASKYGDFLAFAAYVFGLVYAQKPIQEWLNKLPHYPKTSFDTDAQDAASWNWQSLTELGYFQAYNESDPIQVVGEYYNISAFKTNVIEKYSFSSFPESSFPDQLNNSHLLALGGWNMNASNVMFGNGEFDPWRAFSVASQEEGSGNRSMTQTVPACNQPPNGTDVFGAVYAGAVHAEDMSTPTYVRGSIDETTPLEQGLDLFLKAWDVWLPCFNETRAEGTNGTGSSSGKQNSVGRVKIGMNMWVLVAGITAMILGI